MRLRRKTAVTNIERRTSTLAPARHDKVRQRFASAFAAFAIETREGSDDRSLPLG